MELRNGILSFRYGYNGSYTIVMENAFPAPKVWLKKFMTNVVALNYEERCQIARAIMVWLQDNYSVATMQADMKAYANGSVDKQTKAVEMQPQIDVQEMRVQHTRNYIKTLPCGEKKEQQERLKQEKEKLKELKERQRTLKASARSCNGYFLKTRTKINRLESNMELIQQLITEWENEYGLEW